LSIKRDAIAAKFNLQAILINGLGGNHSLCRYAQPYRHQ
jgi:hypothetical protein